MVGKIRKAINSIVLLIQPLTMGYLSTLVSDYLTSTKNSFQSSEVYLKLKSLYSFTPQPYLFGIVWPILFILMGLAIWRIYRKYENREHRKDSLILNQVQIFLSFLWSPLYLYNVSYAFALILFLNVSVWILLYFYYKTDKTSFILMLPYTFWLLFATLLNYLSI